MKDDNLITWLGFDRNIDFSQNKWVGGLLGFLLGAVVLCMVLVGFGVFLHLLRSLFFPNAPTSVAEDTRNLGLAAAAIIGVPFLIWRSIVAQKQVDIAEQGQITDRINKAIEGLGTEKTVKRQRRNNKGELLYQNKDDNSGLDYKKPIMEEITAPNLEVRIGSIFALERLSNDSLRDHIQIMEVLCAYVRENAKTSELIESEKIDKKPSLRFDIQTALTVLGRRSDERIKHEWSQRFRLNFNETDLSGADLCKSNFSGALFEGCKMEFTNFERAKLNGSSFRKSILNHSNFGQADLSGACLKQAKLKYPPSPFGSSSLSLGFAELRGVDLSGADLASVTLLGKFFGNRCQAVLTFGSSDTLIPSRLEKVRENLASKNQDLEPLDAANLAEMELGPNSSEAFLKCWSPFSSEDIQTAIQLSDFRNALGLTQFPYSD